MNMTLRQIRFFLAVCEDHSLSKAARRLYMKPPALSRAISELEQELGVVLFLRTNVGMQLTEYGLQVRKRFEEVIPILEGLTNELREMHQEGRITLPLVVAYGITSSLSPELWLKFMHEYPGIELSIRDLPDIQCEAALEKKECDLILTIGPVDETKFHAIPIKTEPMYLAIATGNPLFSLSKITLADMPRARYINVSREFRSHKNIHDYFARHEVPIQPYYCSNEFNLLQEMAENDKGIFFMPEHTIDFSKPGMRYEQLPYEGVNWNVCIAVRKNEQVSKPVGCLIQYVLAKTAKYRA